MMSTQPAAPRPLERARARPQPRAHSPLRDPVDAHIGARLKLRRRMLGLSQSDLAERLAVTYQQVCKYEAGDNRISAAKLFLAANVLGCPITFFFEGLGPGAAAKPARPSSENAERILNHFLARPDGLRLAGEFPKIRSRRLRRQLMRLVSCLAEEVSARG